jgi:apolipoprotein N-acyltransferase
VRAANTGISGVVDARGRIVAAIGLGLQGAIDVPLPAPGPSTIFARFGNWIPAALACVFFVASIMFFKINSLREMKQTATI